MIPILYEKNETDFTNNGLARLRDCISCIVTEERNGIYECDFEYPVGGANYDLIECGRIIAVTHDETDDVQPFDIVSYSRPIDGIVSFHAVHISYRQSKLTVSGTNINSLQDALALLTTAQPSNPFGYWTDKTSDALFSAADGVPRSVKQMLGGMEGSILDCYGGEYEWDKWTVRLWGARGIARDFSIRYGVNLTGYEEEVNYSDTYTSCIPYWIGSDDNGDIIIQGNKVSTNEVPYDGHEACVPLDLTDKFDEQPTTQQLEEMAAEMMANDKVFVPAQTIKVEFIRLQDSPDYENYASLLECRLCDSVNVYFPNYGVSGSFKIVKTVYNVLQDKYDEMELGTLSVTLSSAIDGGSSSPSVSDVNVIRMAAEAQNDANIANGILISMDEAAQAAHTTLEGIYADAENSKNLLSDMEDAATAAQTTLTGIYADAETAKTQAASALSSASTALTAAQSAQTSANSALVSLSTVEDVVGVLNWITAHGTMTLTSDVAINPAHVYFVVDPAGDYVVGGTHYSIVAEPKDEDISTYYELSIDESVQNYVATHVVVDTEGLWLIPDSGGNKVLIATGAGSSYTTAGTYIIGKVNGVDTVFAKFTTDGATMNATNNTQIAHLGYGSGNAESGTATKPYYSFGVRSGTVGNYSVAEGNSVTKSQAQGGGTVPLIASGYCSHAEGGGAQSSGAFSHAENCGTEAKAHSSHAEGRFTIASGNYSHAQNDGTKAQGESQTALGKYNVADSTSAVIIGNGTADNARSNALTVDWSGNINIASGAKYKINGTNLSASDVGAVPTSRTVNSKALSSNITLSASDVGAVATSRITGSAEAGKIPEIGSNGVMELPQILDLHNSTLDYDVRIITTTTGTKGQATLNIRCGKLQFWGVDSDYIVEQGTNYRKWYSGLAECWGTATNGSSGYVTVTFPLTFKAAPMCVASAHYLSNGTYVAPTVSVAPSTTGATFYLRVSTSTVTQGHTVSYEAKGRWK